MSENSLEETIIEHKEEVLQRISIGVQWNTLAKALNSHSFYSPLQPNVNESPFASRFFAFSYTFTNGVNKFIQNGDYFDGDKVFLYCAEVNVSKHKSIAALVFISRSWFLKTLTVKGDLVEGIRNNKEIALELAEQLHYVPAEEFHTYVENTFDSYNGEIDMGENFLLLLFVRITVDSPLFITTIDEIESLFKDVYIRNNSILNDEAEEKTTFAEKDNSSSKENDNDEDEKINVNNVVESTNSDNDLIIFELPKTKKEIAAEKKKAAAAEKKKKMQEKAINNSKQPEPVRPTSSRKTLPSKFENDVAQISTKRKTSSTTDVPPPSSLVTKKKKTSDAKKMKKQASTKKISRALKNVEKETITLPPPTSSYRESKYKNTKNNIVHNTVVVTATSPPLSEASDSSKKRLKSDFEELSKKYNLVSEQLQVEKMRNQQLLKEAPSSEISLRTPLTSISTLSSNEFQNSLFNSRHHQTSSLSETIPSHNSSIATALYSNNHRYELNSLSNEATVATTAASTSNNSFLNYETLLQNKIRMEENLRYQSFVLIQKQQQQEERMKYDYEQQKLKLEQHEQKYFAYMQSKKMEREHELNYFSYLQAADKPTLPKVDDAELAYALRILKKL